MHRAPHPSTRRTRPVVLTLVGTAVAAALVLAPATSAAPKAAPVLEGVPRFDHVVVLTLENETATQTFSPTSPAPYLRSLRAKGVFLPSYYGTGHVSLDNYVAMVSGQPELPTTGSDCAAVSLWTCAQPQALVAGGRNLADQLEDARLSWRSYEDGAPTPCFHAAYSPSSPAPDAYQGNSTTGAKNFADRHVPFLYFPDVVGDESRCAAHLRPFTELSRDLRRDTLPAFSFVTPDTCHDGHDNPCAGTTTGGLAAADAWLRTVVPPLTSYLARHNGLLVINFDEGFVPTHGTDLAPTAADLASHPEDYGCRTCALGGLGGRTGALLLSPRLPQGRVEATEYDHFSLLRTLEDAFGITEHLGYAAQATPMTAAFRGARR